MKRSLAPSSVLAKRFKLAGEYNAQSDSSDSEAPAAASSSMSCPVLSTALSSLHGQKINHLDRWKVLLEKTQEKENSSEEAGDDLDDGEAGGTRSSSRLARSALSAPSVFSDAHLKNESMIESSPPLYYVGYYFTRGKDDKGNALVKLTYQEAQLLSMDNKQIAKATLSRTEYDEDDPDHPSQQKILIKSVSKKRGVFICPGSKLMIGQKDVEVGIQVSEEDVVSGMFFMKHGADSARLIDKFAESAAAAATAKKPQVWLAAARRPRKGEFQVPFKGTKRAALERRTEPLHSPYAPGAVVLYSPPGGVSGSKIPVVIDPVLGTQLRPHQKAGVQFMFDCVMGLNGKTFNGRGCILADDMGLGKSIQAIAILWTLLKQSPEGLPATKKALVVCPSSLVGNWCAELKKWLGDAIRPVPVGESSPKTPKKIRKFEHEDYDVLIISYDQLKIYCEEISKIKDIDLLIADEGHRLKNAAIKTSKAISMMPTRRRIILSGTPIQNDLQEFYAMVSFVNPDILSSTTKFKNVFEAPILRSREPGAEREIKDTGFARAVQLSQLVSPFILRRTSATNLKYLPPKVERTIFCRLSELQVAMYQQLCMELKPLEARSKAEKLVLQESGFVPPTGQTLPLITLLKKLCNTPDLLRSITRKDGSESLPPSVARLFPKGFKPNYCHPEHSGKLQFLDQLLQTICKKTPDRIVIVSNYTQTLDVLATLCKLRGIYFFQLDGSTVVAKRQQLVDLFNLPTAKERVFLLSSKAGGVGLNLIGANHLVLYDGDWNPANDAQAMARVWRPGQKKECVIYRLLSSGTIEEKIFQRQVTKLALSSSIVEQQNDDKPNFTTAELRDLFTLRLDTTSDTHDLLGCRCSATAVRIPVHLRSSSVSVSSLMKYDHCDDITKCEDSLLAGLNISVVSFMLSSRTEAPPEPEETTDGGGDEVQVEETGAEAFVNAPVAGSSSSSANDDDEDE